MVIKIVAVYLVLVLVLNQGFQEIQNPLFQPRPSNNQFSDPSNNNGVSPSGSNDNIGGNPGGSNSGTGPSGNTNGGGNSGSNNNGPNLKPYCPECFDDWFTKYSSMYGFSNNELAYRRNIFTQNYNKIIAHNRLTNVTYKKGLNQFTGLTKQQFQRISFGQQPGQTNSTVVQESFPSLTPPNRLGIPSFPNQQTDPIPKDWVPPPGQGIVNAPSGFLPPTNPVRLLQQTNFFNFLGWDWRGVKGALSPVKDQKNCGGCYAFAATGAAESAIMISRGYWNVELSEQQIIDCTAHTGNKGCQGGFKDRSLKYIETNGLVASEAYPFENKHNKNLCKYSSGDYKIKSMKYINGCANFRRSVRKAPVAVSVSAYQWESYHSGIMQCPEGARVAHAGLLVGYTPQLHWIFKNSWGTHWGENGYIRIDVFKNCGICVKVGAQAFM